jgi:hypothetical protein
MNKYFVAKSQTTSFDSLSKVVILTLSSTTREFDPKRPPTPGCPGPVTPTRPFPPVDVFVGEERVPFRLTAAATMDAPIGSLLRIYIAPKGAWLIFNACDRDAEASIAPNKSEIENIFPRCV